MNVFVGDTHGDFQRVWETIQKSDLRDCNLIHVGDIGLGFPAIKQNFIEKWDRLFRRRNITFYGIRGNHDDPAYFKPEFCRDNFIVLEDNVILEVGGDTIFFSGGAISIDRCRDFRIQGKSWWHDEGFVEADWDSVIGDRQIDIVVTHQCPISVIPVDPPVEGNKFFTFINSQQDDPELVKDLIKEHNMLDRLESWLIKNQSVKNWYFGHYHVSANQVKHDIKYRCLDINEMHYGYIA